MDDGKKETIYKDGCCQYTDGSPSYVRPFEHVDKIPADYVEFHTKYKSDPVEAWQATMQFRQKMGIWNLLRNPSPLHRKMEAINPIVYHGHSKEGFPAVWEIGKSLNTAEFAKISTEDHLRRVHYISEFGRNILCEGGACVPGFQPDRPKDRFGVVFVMDIGEMDLGGYFGGGPFQLRCSSFDDLRHHWPQQVRHALVINVPYMLLSFARPILNGAMWGFTHNPQSVPPKMVLETLRTQFDDDQIPQEYGGSSPYKLGEHPYQLKMKDLIDEYLPLSPATDDDKSEVDVDVSIKSPEPSIEVDEYTPREPSIDVDEYTPREPTSTTSEDNVVLRLLKLSYFFVLSLVARLRSLVGGSGNSKSTSGQLLRTYSSSDVALISVSDDSIVSSGETSPTGSEISYEVPHSNNKKKKKRRASFLRLRRSIKRMSLKKISFRRRSTNSPKDD